MIQCQTCRRKLMMNYNYTHAPKNAIFLCMDCYERMKNANYVVLPLSHRKQKSDNKE